MKIIYILIGVPNSGKSTWSKAKVEENLRNCRTTVIHSTDEYFMVNGKYMFDVTKLGAYHARNLQAAKESIDQGIDDIIIDNTNIKERDYRDYVVYAASKGYVIHQEMFRITLDEALQRNKKRESETGKRIPDDVIKKMLEAFNKL